MDAAATGHHIWVAAGTYTPTQEGGGRGARFKTFLLINGVELYGGFAGSEDPATYDLDDRDFDLNETIRSGDLGGGVNVYHVFRHENLGLSSTAVLDGFTISEGKADGADPDNVGGGMLILAEQAANGSSPTLRNCMFKNNHAQLGGSRYISEHCNPSIEHCTFDSNTAIHKDGFPFSQPLGRGGCLFIQQ